MKKIKFKKEVWAIVTARKKSKSIYRKNIVRVKGKELIKYSYDELKKINYLKKIITSSDDEKIKKISSKYNFDFFDRKSYLTGDKINSVNVVLDVLNEALKKFNYLPESFLLIQPTSIFLNSKHIKKIITVLKKNNYYKSAQTIIKVPHQFHAYNQRSFKDNSTKFVFEKKRKKMHNKQTKPIFYAYGNLIALKTKSFKKKKKFFFTT